MPTNFNEFTQGTTLSETDQLVGFANTSAGGERRWQLGNLRNSLITGAATTIDTENLAANKVLVSDASGKVGASPVTSTELGYLGGTISNIQTQINAKLSAANFTGTNQSLTTNGYQKLPGGLIMQWGLSPSYNTQSRQTVTLPITFPNSLLNINATWNISTYDDSASGDTFVQVISSTNSSITFLIQNTRVTLFTSGKVYWSAIGY